MIGRFFAIAIHSLSIQRRSLEWFFNLSSGVCKNFQLNFCANFVIHFLCPSQFFWKKNRLKWRFKHYSKKTVKKLQFISAPASSSFVILALKENYSKMGSWSYTKEYPLEKLKFCQQTWGWWGLHFLSRSRPISLHNIMGPLLTWGRVMSSILPQLVPSWGGGWHWDPSNRDGTGGRTQDLYVEGRASNQISHFCSSATPLPLPWRILALSVAEHTVWHFFSKVIAVLVWYLTFSFSDS